MTPPPLLNDPVEEELWNMFNGGSIKPSSLLWAFQLLKSRKRWETKSPHWLSPSPPGDERGWCPLPNFEEILEGLEGCSYFNTLDLFYGYWQISLAEHCMDMNTFKCKLGTSQFKLKPFGLLIDPATCQRMMSEEVEGLPYARVYVNEIEIFLKDHTSQMKGVKTVLRRASEAELRLKIKNYNSALSYVLLLGHVVSQGPISVDPEKTGAIQTLQFLITGRNFEVFWGWPPIISYSSKISQKRKHL